MLVQYNTKLSIRIDRVAVSVWAIATSLDNLHIEISATNNGHTSYEKTLEIDFDVTKMFSVQFGVHILFCPLMPQPPISYFTVSDFVTVFKSCQFIILKRNDFAL